MPREWLIQHRAGTLAEWAAAEASGPALLAGERAYITDTKTDVVGDGVTKVASLGAVGSGTYALVFKPEKYGAVGDGVTDDSAAIQATLQAIYDAGGGVCHLTGGKIYRCDSQILVPHGSETVHPSGKCLRITGDGYQPSTYGDPSTYGGAMLDLRFAGATGKIVAIGQGIVEIDHVVLIDNGTSSTPFVYSTQAIIKAHHATFATHKTGTSCNQDAVVLGGLTTQYDATVNSGFAGYGSSVTECNFSGIQRLVYMRAWANGVVVSGNWAMLTCGGAAAIEIDPGTATVPVATFAASNIVRDNTIEMPYYTYGVKVVNNAARNIFIGNGFWDAGIAANQVSDYYFGSTTSKNLVIATGESSTTTFVDDSNHNAYIGMDRVLGGPSIATGADPLNVRGTGGVRVDNGSGFIVKDNVGTGRAIARISSGNVTYIGDADGGIASGPVIVRASSTGRVTMRSGTQDMGTFDAAGFKPQDGFPIIFGSTNGSQIGSSGTQKLAFYGATPVIRPTGTPAVATDLATALTLLNDVRAKLITLGLIA